MPRIKKAPRKEFELLKPVGFGGKPVEPAVDGKPPVMVKLRVDQAERRVESGHIKIVA